jgi:hypothetical protein
MALIVAEANRWYQRFRGCPQADTQNRDPLDLADRLAQGRSGDGEPAPRRIRSLARGTGYARRAFRNLPRFSQITGVGDGVKPDLSYVMLTFLIR